MKATDIEVGKDYAVGRKAYPQRGRVLEVGRMERDVRTGKSWRTTKKVLPSVRVLMVSRETGEEYNTAVGRTHEQVLPLTQVYRSWDDEEATIARRAAAIEDSHARTARMRTKGEQVTLVLAEKGIKANVWVEGSKLDIRFYDEANVDAFLASLA